MTTNLKADTFDYAGGGSLSAHDAGTSGSLAVGSNFSMFDELMEIDNETTHHVTSGDLGKVTMTADDLSKCAAGFCFAIGTLEITSSSGAVIFKGALTDGTLFRKHGALFLNASDTGGGTVAIESKNGVFSSNSIVSTTVPEVSTLWLLGTGLFGLYFGRRWLA